MHLKGHWLNEIDNLCKNSKEQKCEVPFVVHDNGGKNPKPPGFLSQYNEISCFKWTYIEDVYICP